MRQEGPFGKASSGMLAEYSLTKWAMTVISVEAVLTGATIKTRVTLTVIDGRLTRFAWVHKTTHTKMDESGKG